MATLPPPPPDSASAAKWLRLLWDYVRGLSGDVSNLSGGLTTTVQLAKITAGGTDGSLTFTNGVLTAKVDPT